MFSKLMESFHSCGTEKEQGLVFSVELHLSLISHPLTLPLVPYPIVLFFQEI